MCVQPKLTTATAAMAAMADAQARRAEFEAIEAVKRQERDETTQAFERVHIAVQSGDVDALRAAFEGRNGLILGRLTKQGSLERMILLEMMNAPGAPLELLEVFFRELGGRFLPDQDRTYSVHVYSLLIDIDSGNRIASEQEVGRWTERMAEIVGYIAETLGQPVPRWTFFSKNSNAYSLNCTQGTLIQMAWNNEAYAAWSAFAKHVPPLEGQTAFNIIDRMALQQNTEPYSNFWFLRSVPDITDDALERLMSRQETEGPHQQYAFRPLMNAEAERRRTTRFDVRLLFVCKNHFKKEQKIPEEVIPEEVMEKIITMARSGFQF